MTSESMALTLKTSQYLHHLHPEASEMLITYENWLLDRLNISPKYTKTDRLLLQQLLSNFNSELILELGTDAGISTLAICETKLPTQSVIMITDQPVIIGFLTKYLQGYGAAPLLQLKHQRATEFLLEFIITKPSKQSMTLLIHSKEFHQLLSDQGIVLWFQMTKVTIIIFGILEEPDERSLETIYPFLFLPPRETTFLPLLNGLLVSFYFTQTEREKP